MRVPMRSRTRGGFTLIELMMTCALIGVLAAIAIPQFVTFQARSRRSEGFTNLAAIGRAYKAYYGERGDFPDMIATTTAGGGAEATLPDPTEHGLPAPGTMKMPWDAKAKAFFGIVGFHTEGLVFYTYDVVSQGCGCTQCFTASAHGDVDANGLMSTLMLVHPQTDASGTVLGSCTDAVNGYGPPTQPPPPHGTGLAIYDEPAVHLSGDSY